MDLFSLTVLAGLMLGLAAGDVALFSSRIGVQMSVPSKLTETGFTQATAERLFVSEVGQIADVTAVLPIETIDMRSNTSVLAAMVKPLGMDGVVTALQQQLGIDTISIAGSIMLDATPPKLHLVLVIGVPGHPLQRVLVDQDDGNTTKLMARAAETVMMEIIPYRVALRQFERGLRGDAASLVQARDTADNVLAREWDPNQATQRVFLRNLLALLALEGGDAAAAEAQYKLAEPVPGQSEWGHALIAFNRSFLAVASKQPARAHALLQIVDSVAAKYDYGVGAQAALSRLVTMHGLVAWSEGNTVQAERQFRGAIATQLPDPEPHMYLAQLLAARGDAAGAAAERDAAVTESRFYRPLPGLAQTEFWVDPVNGGLKQRKVANGL
jgi:hypothetical protein